MKKNKVLLIVSIIFTFLSFIVTLINGHSSYVLIELLPTIDLSDVPSNSDGSGSAGIIVVLIFLAMAFAGFFIRYFGSLIIAVIFLIISLVMTIINLANKYKKTFNISLLVVNIIILISLIILFLLVKYNIEFMVL